MMSNTTCKQRSVQELSVGTRRKKNLCREGWLFCSVRRKQTGLIEPPSKFTRSNQMKKTFCSLCLLSLFGHFMCQAQEKNYVAIALLDSNGIAGKESAALLLGNDETGYFLRSDSFVNDQWVSKTEVFPSMNQLNNKISGYPNAFQIDITRDQFEKMRTATVSPVNQNSSMSQYAQTYSLNQYAQPELGLSRTDLLGTGSLADKTDSQRINTFSSSLTLSHNDTFLPAINPVGTSYNNQQWLRNNSLDINTLGASAEPLKFLQPDLEPVRMNMWESKSLAGNATFKKQPDLGILSIQPGLKTSGIGLSDAVSTAAKTASQNLNLSKFGNALYSLYLDDLSSAWFNILTAPKGSRLETYASESINFWMDQGIDTVVGSPFGKVSGKVVGETGGKLLEQFVGKAVGNGIRDITGNSGGVIGKEVAATLSPYFRNGAGGMLFLIDAFENADIPVEKIKLFSEIASQSRTLANNASPIDLSKLITKKLTEGGHNWDMHIKNTIIVDDSIPAGHYRQTYVSDEWHICLNMKDIVHINAKFFMNEFKPVEGTHTFQNQEVEIRDRNEIIPNSERGQRGL